MNDREAYDLVQETFNLIKVAKNEPDLDSIPEKLGIRKYDPLTYPRIKFTLLPSEIEDLKEAGLLNDDYSLNNEVSKKIKDPLAKILYSILWKKGELNRVRLTAMGVVGGKKCKHLNEDRVVLYHLGESLSGRPNSPIIDQHVIRAFAIYKANGEIQIFRKIDSLTKKHCALIIGYKKWLVSNELKQLRAKVVDYSYQVDKVLYAVGKQVKLKKGTAQLYRS